MEITALGIDLAKTVFQLHGVDSRGKAVLRKKVSRAGLLAFMANLPKCLIGMESCGSSNYWAREFVKLGHEVRLIPPQFVKPFVKGNKNDANDAEAICEALLRPNMRFVAPKSVEGQDLQSLHRVRTRLVIARSALSNEIRGLLAEYGIALPVGAKSFRKYARCAIEEALKNEKITTMSHQTFTELLEEFEFLVEREEQYDRRIEAIHRAHPVCRRLDKVPGVGSISATAIVAAVADPSAFKNGRQFAAWLGLVPKQSSSGGKEKLLGISKRGNVYLRSLLIHGARAVVRWNDKREKTREQEWLKQLIERRGVNKAAVALANKNARRIWVLLARDEEFKVAA